MPTDSREEWLSYVLSSLPDHVFILDEQGHYTDSFGGAHFAAGFDVERYTGLHLSDVLVASKANQLLSYLEEVFEHKRDKVVKYAIAPTDLLMMPIDSIESMGAESENWFEAILRYVPQSTAHGPRVIWSVRDVTRTHLLEQELKTLSETDELTEILNRRAFFSGLDSALRRAQKQQVPLACLMIDIDHFKEINDQVGHLSGDEVIKHVAQICKQVVRGSDYLGRLGGEEFGVVLSHTNAIDAYDVAERIRESIATTECQVEGHAIHPTVSIGIAEVNPSITSSKGLLIQADKAMYYSKQTGRNQVTLYHDGLPDMKAGATNAKILYAS